MSRLFRILTVRIARLSQLLPILTVRISPLLRARIKDFLSLPAGKIREFATPGGQHLQAVEACPPHDVRDLKDPVDASNAVPCNRRRRQRAAGRLLCEHHVLALMCQ